MLAGSSPMIAPGAAAANTSRTAAARAGAAIVPAMPAFYFKPESFEDLADFIAGRVLSLLGIPHELFRAWEG